MNNKISSGQVLTIEIGLLIALFPGLVNLLVLNIAKNSSLISIILSFIIGFIPLLLTVSISKNIKNETLKNYLEKKLGIIGKIINIFLIIIAIYILFLSSWLDIDYIISQFLTRTSYYYIAIIFSIIIAWNINKGIETTSRTIFIVFIITMSIIILLWLSLLPYVKLENLKPYIDTSKDNIIKSTFLYMFATTTPIIYIIELKNKTKDKKNFEKKIVIGYIITYIITFIYIFLIISIYTIDIANIFTYPIYSLFKKVQFFGFIERIENFAGIQILVSFYIQASFLIYYLKENISKTLKIKDKKKKNILTYIISILIPIMSITVFKEYNLINFIKITPYIIGSLLIVIAIIFITSKLINNKK